MSPRPSFAWIAATGVASLALALYSFDFVPVPSRGPAFASVPDPSSASAPIAACPDPRPAGCRDYTRIPVPPGDLSDVSPLRRAIVAAAATQIGRVSELNRGDGAKCGWENLAAYYAIAYEKPLRRSEYAKLKRAMSIVPVVNPEHPDPKDPDHYVFETDPEHPELDDPLHFRHPKRPKTVVRHEKINEWCGIFALWAVKTGASGPMETGDADAAAAIGASFWKYRKASAGWGIGGLRLVMGHQGIKPGDIAYFRGNAQHQGVVERVLGRKIHTIDGNQDCQQVGRKVSDIRSVAGYYRAQ